MDDRNPHYCLFETAIGACGIAWSARGLLRLQLPETDRDATEDRLRRRIAGAPPGAAPPDIAAGIAAIQNYLEGEEVDFAGVGVDLGDAGEFYRQIYDATRAVGWGQTASYGDIARRVGAPGAARVVGQAMASNPVPLIIPCHRILAGGNRMGGFSAPGGTATKARLLALEGVQVGAPRLPGL